MTHPTYNIAIVGQTGVGKSTLINYLYPEAKASTGIGKPVTKNGFHPYNFDIEGMPVCIFDSWGLEVGKEDIWRAELKNELIKRGVDKPSQDWFHSVFYCIGASGARIQDCDLKIIKQFHEQSYPISIILTKADTLSVEDEQTFIAAINKDLPSVKVISVCSENKITRAGEVKAFGKEAVEKQAFLDFFDALVLRIPEKCKHGMESVLEKWVADARLVASDKITMFSAFTKNHEDIINSLNNGLNKLQNEIDAAANLDLKTALNTYNYTAQVIGYGIATLQKNNEQESSDTPFFKNEFYDRIDSLFTVAASLLSPITLPFVLGWSLRFAKMKSEAAVESYILSVRDTITKDLILKKEEEIKGFLHSLKLKIEQGII